MNFWCVRFKYPRHRVDANGKGWDWFDNGDAYVVAETIDQAISSVRERRPEVVILTVSHQGRVDWIVYPVANFMGSPA